MFRFWRKNKEIDEFAIILVGELYNQVPQQVMEEKKMLSDKKIFKKFDKALRKIDIRLEDCKAMHKYRCLWESSFPSHFYGMFT